MVVAFACAICPVFKFKNSKRKIGTGKLHGCAANRKECYFKVVILAF